MSQEAKTPAPLMAANMTRADLVAEAKNWIAQVAIAAHRHSPAQIKVAVEALEAFINQLAAHQAEGWISVEDRLPQEGTPVFVTKDGGVEYFEVDVMEEGAWRNWLEYVEHVEIIGGRTSDVKLYTHWMPLPVPAAPSIPSNGGAGELVRAEPWLKSAEVRERLEGSE